VPNIIRANCFLGCASFSDLGASSALNLLNETVCFCISVTPRRKRELLLATIDFALLQFLSLLTH
jgi:hypothetical protein